MRERLAKQDLLRSQQSFFSQFYLFNGLSKLRSLPQFRTREDLFQGLAEREGESFVQAAVQSCKCDPSWPICMYDFTFKNLFTHHYLFRTKEPLRDLLIKDYIPTEKLLRNESLFEQQRPKLINPIAK